MESGRSINRFDMSATHINIQSQTKRFAYNALKIGLFLGLLGVTLPFWWPESLGGDVALQFVLTSSMKGELGPGSFVIVRRSDDYQVGDIAVYKLTQSNGKSISIVHRIVGRLPDGRYIFKGDANRGSETVDPQQVIGKMVVGVPGLGFIPGAIKAAPVIVGALLMVPFLLGRKQHKDGNTSRKFWPIIPLSYSSDAPEGMGLFDIFIRNDGTLEEFYDVIDNQLVPFVESFVFDFPEPEEPKEKECLISN